MTKEGEKKCQRVHAAHFSREEVGGAGPGEERFSRRTTLGFQSAASESDVSQRLHVF